ncbi:ATP-binding cassette domain-containing protein [Confluentibacter flavum]|uniref:ABC transporter ATP-binding protein n=1 Tax=Confluentibacter flavum TaxID=1909700 RepID=A0A2N3HMP5_9FLAO|nr:ABC transporter ATP-binding protein [Confluentibacter flavum]PKQ46118.1 ABC transporter ATP-binding protein [Confluentibacter flavum]
MTLEIDNVELFFKEKRILNGIYLKAETGHITGILGSNGCGKSCLLKIIFGDLNPKYKLIRINSKPILKPLYQTKLVSYLPQHHFIPNNLNTKTAFKLFNVDWIDFTITFPSFAFFENLKFHRLSGGERRVVEVFLILKSSSKIILLDEPFSHIAPLYIKKITSLIETEKHQKAIIITDHMYQHIVDVSDAIYLLKNGCSKLINNLKNLRIISI